MWKDGLFLASMAQFVIENSGSVQDTLEQVELQLVVWLNNSRRLLSIWLIDCKELFCYFLKTTHEYISVLLIRGVGRKEGTEGACPPSSPLDEEGRVKIIDQFFQYFC